MWECLYRRSSVFSLLSLLLFLSFPAHSFSEPTFIEPETQITSSEIQTTPSEIHWTRVYEILSLLNAQNKNLENILTVLQNNTVLLNENLQTQMIQLQDLKNKNESYENELTLLKDQLLLASQSEKASRLLADKLSKQLEEAENFLKNLGESLTQLKTEVKKAENKISLLSLLAKVEGIIILVLSCSLFISMNIN